MKAFNIFSTLLILCFCFQAKAQEYNAGIGIKMGNMVMLSYKHFVTEEVALEGSTGIYLIEYPGIFTNLIATYHVDTKHENLYWFYGAGVGTRLYRPQSQIGFAGALGIDAKIPGFPINFSIGYQPVVFYERTIIGFFPEPESINKFFITGPATVSMRIVW